MSVGGYGSGGASGAGPSRMFLSLPWKGWREVGTWIEEFVDACGLRFDILNSKFISATARANNLDPTVTPSDSPSTYLATSVAPAVNTTSTDTLLDVLVFIALGLYPIDSNLTVAQKQALVQVGWTALKRKGTRVQLLNLLSQITDGVVAGWTIPSNQYGMILSDGAPAPGWGGWVQSASTIPAAIRPWILAAGAQVLSRIVPAWDQIGLGFSQFRAGYSAAGEASYNAGVRIGILANSSFTTWTASVPDNWTTAGSATLTQSSTASYINFEFTTYAARFDLTAAAAGASRSLSQTTTAVNNQLQHRVVVDYAYANAQGVSTLAMQITDANADGTTYYWTGTAWSSTATSIVLPVSSTRTRYGTNVTLQSASSTTTRAGTTAITVKVIATSDGTATTQTTYDIYRIDVFERFSLTQETAAGGERTFWAPLVDALGWTTSSRSSGAVILEPANYNASSYKSLSGTVQDFPYHPAFSGRAMRATAGWSNLLKGTTNFVSDWTVTNATSSLNAQISPLLGEVSATATQFTSTATGGNTMQLNLVADPHSKSYAAGVLVKKLSSDSNFTDVSLSLHTGGTQKFTQTFTVTQSQGWVLLAMPPQTFAVGDTSALHFKIQWGNASTSAQIALYGAYVYDVTGKTGVLYPPIGVSPIGSTAAITASKVVATTATTGTNVLHPLLQRTLVSPAKGTLSLTIVPMFDAASQPDGVIFDVAKDATHDRLKLWVSGGVLKLSRWDDSANLWEASLTLTKMLSPATGSMTWLRDTAITIRCIWDDNSTQLSAGNGNAQGTPPGGSWATPVDSGVVSIGIGNDYNKANQFEGLLRIDPGVVQLGAFTG